MNKIHTNLLINGQFLIPFDPVQLTVWDYEVYIGKTKNGEVDFLAKKDGNIRYIQVTYEMKGNDNDNTIEREFGAYKSIEDNYPKYVISLDKIDLSRGGIIHLNLLEFLLSEDFKKDIT